MLQIYYSTQQPPLSTELQQLSLVETHIDGAKRSLTFSPTPSRTSVYVDSDEEIEFDLPISEDDITYAEVVVLDTDDSLQILNLKPLGSRISHEITQLSYHPQEVVYTAANIPVAPDSIPRCLSPPLEPLNLTKGKQAYHDAIAAKTRTKPRTASPVGQESYLNLGTDTTNSTTPIPPPPPAGMSALMGKTAKASLVRSASNTIHNVIVQSLAYCDVSYSPVRVTTSHNKSPSHMKMTSGFSKRTDGQYPRCHQHHGRNPPRVFHFVTRNTANPSGIL